MPVEETLTKLNALANPAPETLCTLWLDLEAEFRQDTILKKTDFARWVLTNIHRKILNIATDASQAGVIHTLRDDISRQYTKILVWLDVSVGLLLLLFGSEIVNSRASTDSFIRLKRKCPDLHVEQLYDAWTAQPRLKKGHVVHDLYRFQQTGKSYLAAIPSPVRKSKRKANARQTTPSVTASIETAHRESPDIDASPHTPTPLQDLRPSFQDSPERPRRLRQALQSETSSPGVTFSTLLKRAESQTERELQASRFTSWEPDSAGNQDAPSYDSESDDGLGVVVYDPASPPHSLMLDDQSVMEEEGLETVEEDENRHAVFTEPGVLGASAEENTVVEITPSEHGDEVSNLIPGNVTTRSCQKRIYSDSAASTSAKDQQTSFVASVKKPRLDKQSRQIASQPTTPEYTRTPRPTARRTVDMVTVMRGLKTLEDEQWLNDEVINTIGRRLACKKIGVVESLSLASKTRTERDRLRLQPEINKPKALLFLNHSSH
ncbi:hypothetical protein CGRA01v4_14143 [Colletotrichum graminicola]|uniref:Uncharacterized protein n=1 Tax=Colletotrichum graminicola (strain M1.001 / M2 / FGSC 10212) TaxID=645133 RepID=E3R036_COLGM|nr:uncharacterized protein GLRG_11619 [Colletotrichum graminicola M1.001]EFQ36474.1 hypothetical protein GLRG_11619 [Colletotrichum graminicola M1.001]WDK22852.1 hypothetical protein CGRA01v4_14143 [Colletotrichum graminicola]